MEFYVVRHGQTDYNVKQLFQGHIDIALNDVGIAQAKETALKFENIDINVILVSPLKRAVQTAMYITEKVKIPIIIEERLIERSFGKMEGCKNRDDWNIEMMLDYEKNFIIDDIEPIQSLFERIYSFLDEITQKYKEEKVLLVTHGAVSQVIECYFNGKPDIIDFEHLEKLTLKNCEVRKYIKKEK